MDWAKALQALVNCRGAARRGLAPGCAVIGRRLGGGCVVIALQGGGWNVAEWLTLRLAWTGMSCVGRVVRWDRDALCVLNPHRSQTRVLLYRVQYMPDHAR